MSQKPKESTVIFRLVVRSLAAAGIAYGLRPLPTPFIQRFILAFGIWCAMVLIESYLSERGDSR